MRAIAGTVCILIAAALVSAQDKTEVKEAAVKKAAFSADDAVSAAVQRLIALQEGDDHDQWPYEGVYKEKGESGMQLPVGYRVGGTAIVCESLMAVPDLVKDKARVEAMQRGVEFILKALDADRMKVDFISTYDVRNWGHIYALDLFLKLQGCSVLPKEMREQAAKKVPWLIQALCEMSLPAGGWNYSHSGGYRSPAARASPFMTGPALQALFAAQRAGHEVDGQVIDKALDALERGRTGPGGYAYGMPPSPMADKAEEQLGMMDKTPGSAARATCVETTLLLGGRGDKQRLAQAVERFFENWGALEVRRKQTGTHIMPYGVAPYYFLYGHWYCAQAIEMLDDPALRVKQRARLMELLEKTREPDGSWNDRQFDRSAGYGSALAILCLRMPFLDKPSARVLEKKAEVKSDKD
jgi:hypothetical protein